MSAEQKTDLRLRKKFAEEQQEVKSHVAHSP
jgi:hypothetical protein